MKKTVKTTDYIVPQAYIIFTEEALPLCASGVDGADGIDDYTHEEW